MSKQHILSALMFVALAIAAAGVRAEESKWEKDIQKFEALDRKQMPEPGGVVFVGSSSIRMWDTARFFPEMNVINRGFGGSEVHDSVAFADRIVTKYKPRVVLLYAGDNDIARGKTAEQVHDDVMKFVDKVRRKLPDVKIGYIAIKPSISRWGLSGQMAEANRMIAESLAKGEGLVYVDIWTPMIGDDGTPRRELFVKDGLHLSEAGYELWTTLVKPVIAQ